MSIYTDVKQDFEGAVRRLRHLTVAYVTFSEPNVNILALLEQPHRITEAKLRTITQTLQDRYRGDGLRVELTLAYLNGRHFSELWPRGYVDDVIRPQLPSFDEEWSDVGFPYSLGDTISNGTKARDFLIVVSLRDNRVARIIQSPYEGEFPVRKRLDNALTDRLSDIESSYPFPEYDIIIGQGDLDSVKDVLPSIWGWKEVPVEDLKV